MTWLSMLFSIMSLGAEYAIRLGEKQPQGSQLLRKPDAVAVYCQRSAECLILADYLKPTVYSVEALVLYMICELIRAQNSQFAISILFSIVVRISMRVGYHRDPSRFSHVSIFDGEMRRRVWSIIAQLDLLFAFQLGQPVSINHEDCDTKMPHDIAATNLRQGMTSLPPPRVHPPPDQLTYALARASISDVLCRIHKSVSSIRVASYEVIILLYEQLNTRFSEVPHCLKIDESRAAQPNGETPSVIMRRVSLDLLYQKARCVLHRNFMSLGNQLYTLSRETCVDAALKIIGHQSFIESETKPGRSYYGHGWKVIGLHTSDFLLAAMVLCLALKTTNRDMPTLHTEYRGSSALYQVLEESYRIWMKWVEYTKEAGTVAGILRVLLDNAREKDNISQASHTKDSATEPSSVAPASAKAAPLITPNNPPGHATLATTALPVLPFTAAAGDGSTGVPFCHDRSEQTGSTQDILESMMIFDDNIDWVGDFVLGLYSRTANDFFLGIVGRANTVVISI